MSILKMFSTVSLLLVLSVVVSAEDDVSNGSGVKPQLADIVGTLLANKALNETANSTAKPDHDSMMEEEDDDGQRIKRSWDINKSAKSELMASLWRIPMLIWDFIVTVLLAPIWASVKSVAHLIGLGGLFDSSSSTSNRSLIPIFYLRRAMEQWMPAAVNQYYAYTEVPITEVPSSSSSL